MGDSLWEPDEGGSSTAIDLDFSPAARRDTISSVAVSEKVETCRICRSEGSAEDPLFHPCKCSGSIKFVHQYCLMEWLYHSRKKHCELCKTPFRFTKLYDAEMPSELPWRIFITRACIHASTGALSVVRILLVGLVWLGVVPWLIRWAWRWMFWVADAAWAREAFVSVMDGFISATVRNTTVLDSSLKAANEVTGNVTQILSSGDLLLNSTTELMYTMAANVVGGFGLRASSSNTSAPTGIHFHWPRTDPSILSSWTYLSTLTSNPWTNRFILDIFEGQLITCIIIVDFILVFLIREWVVQQQPLANADNIGNVHQQLREAAELVHAENDRHLQEQRGNRPPTQEGQPDEAGQSPRAVRRRGRRHQVWDTIDDLMDHANEHLHRGGSEEYLKFQGHVAFVIESLSTAERVGMRIDRYSERVARKISKFLPFEQMEWLRVLVSHIAQRSLDQRWQRLANAEATTVLNHSERLEGTNNEHRSTTIEPDSGLITFVSEINKLIDPVHTLSRRTPNPLKNDVRNAISGIMLSIADLMEDVRSIEGADEQPTVADSDEGDLTGNEPLPIVNAGPHARANIKRCGNRRMRIAEPSDSKCDDPAEQSVATRIIESMHGELEQESSSGTSILASNDMSGDEEHYDLIEEGGGSDRTPDEEEEDDDDMQADDGSIPPFDHGGLLSRQATPNNEITTPALNVVDAAHTDASAEGEASEPTDTGSATQESASVRLGPFGRMVDWFWGDLEVRPDTNNGRPQPQEAALLRPEHNARAAAFVPLFDGRPANADRGNEPANAARQQHDPEVVAAAAQAGLDPDVVDEAEDLEGVWELIGLQGPIIGLFQTSAFCTLLVSATILCAITLPYLGGKLVLSFTASPMWFCFTGPLQLMSSMADVAVDLALFFSGWMIMLAGLAYNFLSGAAEAWITTSSSWEQDFGDRTIEYATNLTVGSASRLRNVFLLWPTTERLGVNRIFLSASAHAHASLLALKQEIDSIITEMWFAISKLLHASSSEALALSLARVSAQIPSFPAKIYNHSTNALSHVCPAFTSFSSLRLGALTLPTTSSSMDPELVYWNSTDRALAIMAGYTALAALAAVYVTLDTPITRSEAGQRTEKVIRDTLRQAGGVVKVILIISIEMLVFPFYCGLILDLAFLPMFENATILARWNFAGTSPYTFCFVHWFIGTCYMFHFALFVGMCRKILRKGVLWFIRDPDDPTFHPVRDVLERGVITQLRKIAFSAVLYGALVILCLGGVIWTIGRVSKGIFPVHWVSSEPLLEFPIDLLLYNFVIPLAFRLLRPSDSVHSMYAWWLRRCARALRLSHFLFDDRRKDEEGHFQSSWLHKLIARTSDDIRRPTSSHSDRTAIDMGTDPNFQHDGRYVLTPCNDQYRPPKPGEAFLHSDDHDVYIVDKDGERNKNFAKVYVPPHFKLRISLFMVCLWVFSAATGIIVTLVPLVFGRWILGLLMTHPMPFNDVYAYSLGSFVLSVAAFVGVSRLKISSTLEKVKNVDLKSWGAPLRAFAADSLKCAYLYGFVGIVLPLVSAAMLQFYVLLPLRTLFQGFPGTDPILLNTENVTGIASVIKNATASAIGNVPETKLPSFAEPTVHILQEYALGLLFVRIAARYALVDESSRATEALRRITGGGLVRPNIRLATRYAVLPVVLFSTVLLLMPPLAARISITFFSGLGRFSGSKVRAETMIYRFSYPALALCGALVLAGSQLSKATLNWRAKIRDEVYLVGERLHNFGERYPPA